MASVQRSGKTAPRLAQDIQDYDPTHPPGTGRNLLSDVPPVYPERYNGPQDFVSLSACRHHYVRKQMQCSLSDQEQRNNVGTPSKVSAICTKCRHHVQMIVDYAGGLMQPSQNPSGHIHHLIYMSGRQRGGVSPIEVTPKGQVVETFHYECSYLSCSMKTSVRVLSPILTDDRVRVLTDMDLLATRADEAIAIHPERMEGIARPSPITVLSNLRIYITNALRDAQGSKSISSINKRFMACFGVEGEPCKELLEFLGFTFKDEGFWDPPRSNPWNESPYRDPQKIFMDDVAHELAALIEQRPVSEKKGGQIEPMGPPAEDDFLDALEALGYPKTLRPNEFAMAPAPYYEDLGTVENMSSTLIIDAFNRQVSVDSARTSLYLQCLKCIGDLRGGEDGAIIDQAVQVAYSEGKYTDEDVVVAYKYFGLEHDDTRLTEDSIMGKFYAFLSSTTQDTEARMSLWRIGDSRRSERIKSAAEDKVSNAEQAQVFLGVDAKTTDEFIITMYTAKVNDNPSTRDLARRAVELIAESRKSDGLKYYLKTGETGVGEMDVADAYRLLQIPDRTIDDGAIMAAYTICVDEAPDQAEKYNKALSLIAQEKNSSLLGSMVPGGVEQQSGRDLSEWPVGLQNIGNTCYLNSLLQFYFSVRPFREMVLEFENFRMDLDDEEIAKKQIGSRKVQKQEVGRSQRFVRELRTLFREMITCPGSYVIPGQELARLTLINPSNEAAIRRRSTVSASRPSALGEINGMPIMGPLGPPQTTTAEAEARDPGEAPAIAETEKPQRPTNDMDGDSEATLVSENAKQGSSAGHVDNKENAQPSGDGTPSGDVVMAGPNNEAGPEATKDDDSASPKAPDTAPIAPPGQPPPVPPRPVQQVDPQKQLIEEVEIGAQQDVTEVINNLLFQSECAIRPIGISPDGEQLDQVKDLFYGRTKSYLSTGGNVRSREEWWCDIKVDVATGSRDIYTAIDGAFDVQKVNIDNTVAEQFGAISKLPPVLQVQVQRVQFDPVKKTSFKSAHHLDLKETIYLDRYMDSQQPEIISRRQQSWEWKKSLRKLEARRAELLRKSENDGFNMPALFSGAKEVLEELDSMKNDAEAAQDALDINMQIATELGQLSQITQTELAYIDQEIHDTKSQISNQFATYRHLPYRLYAVFIHHGSVEFGHYYIYIYDFTKNIWRKYNDNDVSEVQDPATEIFQARQERENPPTPYFLVYVNEGLKERLVDPVRREIVDPWGGADAVMSDVANVPSQDLSATVSEDVNMDQPPAYEDVWNQGGGGGSGASGTAAHLSSAKEKDEFGMPGNNSGGRWGFDNANNPQTNIEKTHW